MIAILLLAGALFTIDGGDRSQEAQILLNAGDPRLAAAVLREQPCPDDRELLHGFVVDTARIGGGLVADLWSTEYALARRPELRESNPLGLSKNARIWMKAGMATGLIAITHKLRRDGHQVWAKWLGRVAMVVQFAAAGWNVHKAHGHEELK
jgi:hypothetical protein